MKKYNRTLDKNTPLGFPNGGMSTYLDDLFQLENNSYLSGITSILRGWSCVLSGMRVLNVNTTTNRCDVEAGLVMIDDIIYEIPSLTNQTYPFSIVPGTETPDNRGFLEGTTKTVGIDYNFSIRTLFTFTNAIDLYPDLSINEIYFSPFTAQKASIILKNLNKVKGESFLKNDLNFNINKDEAGAFLTGSDLSWNINNVLMWSYYGYKLINNNGGSLNLSSTIGSLTGSNSKLLTESNLPKHEHYLKYGTATEAGSHYHDFENNIGVTDVFHANLGDYSHKNIYNKKNQPQVNLYGADTAITNGKTVVAITDQTIGEPSHTHDVIGKTNAGEYYYDSNNLATTNIQTAIDVSGKIYGVCLLQWEGYPTTYSIVNPLSSTGYQITGYRFWKYDLPYLNM